MCVLYHATSLLSCEKPFNISVKRSTIRSRARPPPPRPDAESSELPKCRPARAAHMVFCACYGAHTIQIKLCHGQHARWRACMLTKPTGVTSASHMSRCAVRQLVTLGAPCIWDNSDSKSQYVYPFLGKVPFGDASYLTNDDVCI